MGDFQQIHLRLGADPWEPADDAEMVHQLNFYDMPTEGILKQSRRFYLFRCLDGHGSEASLWAYAPLRRAEARQLRKAFGAAEVRQLENAVMLGRCVTVVLATTRLGIAAKGQFQIELDDLEQPDEPAVVESTVVTSAWTRIRNTAKEIDAAMTMAV